MYISYCALPSEGAKGSDPSIAPVLWLKTFHVMPLQWIMSEEGMYDTPRLILIVVSLFHTYSLLVNISLIIKLMYIPVETYLPITSIHA